MNISEEKCYCLCTNFARIPFYFLSFISGNHSERRDKAGQHIHSFFHPGNRNGKSLFTQLVFFKMTISFFNSIATVLN